MRIAIPKLNTSALRAFWRCEQGATSIEYALIAVLISVAIIGGLNLFAGSMGNLFNSISNAVANSG